MKDPYYISPVTDNDKLVKILKVGDYVEYSLIYTKTRIREMFKNYNIDFRFCQSGTQIYDNFGPAIIKIISIDNIDIPNVKQIKPAMFDPKMLVT